MSLNERLYNLRVEKDLSQEELANLLGVSEELVFKWELGEDQANEDNLTLVSEVLNTSTIYLLTGKEDKLETLFDRETRLRIKRKEKKFEIYLGISIASMFVMILAIFALKLKMTLLFTLLLYASRIGVNASILSFIAILIVYKDIREVRYKNGIVLYTLAFFTIVVHFFMYFLTYPISVVVMQTGSFLLAVLIIIIVVKRMAFRFRDSKYYFIASAIIFLLQVIALTLQFSGVLWIYTSFRILKIPLIISYIIFSIGVLRLK